jgi:hypothetical protein
MTYSETTTKPADAGWSSTDRSRRNPAIRPQSEAASHHGFTIAVDEASGRAIVVNSAYNPADCSFAVVPIPEGKWIVWQRWLAQRLSWLPLHPPQPPAPLTTGSATLLDTAHM